MVYISLPLFSKAEIDFQKLGQTELGKHLQKILSYCENLRVRLEQYNLNIRSIDSVHQSVYIEGVRASRQFISTLQVKYQAALQSIHHQIAAKQTESASLKIQRDFKRSDLDRQQKYLEGKRDTKWSSFESMQTAQRQLVNYRNEFNDLDGAVSGLEIQIEKLNGTLSLLSQQRGFLLQLEGKWIQFLSRVRKVTAEAQVAQRQRVGERGTLQMVANS